MIQDFEHLRFENQIFISVMHWNCLSSTCLVHSDKILLVIRKMSSEESKSRMLFTFKF